MPPPERNRSRVELAQLHAFLESIRSYAPDLIFTPGDGKPVHHYTDLGGLVGIIEKSDLWLTHAAYLNDAEEMKHGRDVALDVLRKSAPPPAQAADEWNQYIEQVTAQIKDASPDVYIACFCQEDNRLSQWRGYAASGSGVSLRFDPEQFAYIAGPDSPAGGLMRLWKVFYDLDQQRRIIERALEFAFAFAQGKSIEDRADRAVDAIEFFIPTFKNADFEEEHEWRLIFTAPADCSVKPAVRVARGMLVPYYSLNDLRGADAAKPLPLPLTAICVGPNTHRELNAASARRLLDRAGYANVPVVASKTPFRV